MEGLIMSKEIFSEKNSRFRAIDNDKDLDYLFVFEKPMGMFKRTIVALNKNRFTDAIQKTPATTDDNGTIIVTDLPDYLKDLRKVYILSKNKLVNKLDFSSSSISKITKEGYAGIEVDSKHFIKSDKKKSQFFDISPDVWLTSKEDILKEELKKIVKNYNKATDKAEKRIQRKDKRVKRRADKNKDKLIQSMYKGIANLVEVLNRNANKFKNLSMYIENELGEKGGAKFIEIFPNYAGNELNFKSDIDISKYLPKKINIPNKTEIEAIAEAVYSAEYPDSGTKK